MFPGPTWKARHVEYVETSRVEIVEEMGAAGEIGPQRRKFQLARGWCHETQLGWVEVAQHFYQRSCRPGTGEVSRDANAEVVEASEPFSDVKQVNERLGWMVCRAATAVDHRYRRDLQHLTEHFLVPVAEDDRITVPDDATEGIDRCFLFGHARLEAHRLEFDGGGSKSCGRSLKSEAGPG